MGREAALALRPSPHLDEVESQQQQTAEARRLAEAGDGLPLHGIHDIRAPVHRAAIGGALSVRDLLDVRDTLAAARVLKGFVTARREDAPLLAEMGRALAVFPALEAAIGSAIGEDGEILDDASPELARTRRDRRVAESRLRDRLDTAAAAYAALPEHSFEFGLQAILDGLEARLVARRPRRDQ